VFVLFAGLANRIQKTTELLQVLGRFFEPLVLYVRDEIAIQTLEKKITKNT
jgi:F-type H+-transporting ATPase subunit a